MTPQPQINDPAFDQELREMLADVGDQMTEAGARQQALAANSLLALLGNFHPASLQAEERKAFARDVHRFLSYAIALPIVLRPVAAARGCNQEHALRALVFALAAVFETDPIPVLNAMFPETAEVSDGV